MRRARACWKTIAAGLVAAVALVACSADDGPRIRLFDPNAASSAPSQSPPATSPRAPISQEAARRTATAPAGGHVVQAGDTLYRIARRYGVPTRALILRNELAPPYVLSVGQRLAIPAARVHTVAPGETVYAVSRRYGVDMSALVARNGIPPPYTIRVGQRLEIPGEIAEIARVNSPTAVRVQTTPPPLDLENEPLDAPIQPPVVQTAPQPAAPQPAAPQPAAPQTAAAQPAASPPAASPPTRETVAQGAAALGTPFRVTEDGFPRPPLRSGEPPRRSIVLSDDNRVIPKPAPRASDTFLWPVEGRVISRFGPKAGGLHNDGINIAAPRGAPVRAAENGVVVYSGSDLRGFGRMVLIKHADGYITAYGHNSEILVQRGDQVRRGQAIARVGSTGNVERPQLHFEIRKGRRAINPQTRLAA